MDSPSGLALHFSYKALFEILNGQRRPRTLPQLLIMKHFNFLYHTLIQSQIARVKEKEEQAGQYRYTYIHTDIQRHIKRQTKGQTIAIAHQLALLGTVSKLEHESNFPTPSSTFVLGSTRPNSIYLSLPPPCWYPSSPVVSTSM